MLLALGVLAIVATTTVLLRNSIFNFIVVEEDEWVIVQRFGAYSFTAESGFHWIPSPIYSVKQVHWKSNSDVADETDIYNGFRISKKQKIYDPIAITVKASDNLTVIVDPVVYYRIVDPKKVVYEVDNLYRVIDELVYASVIKWSAGKTAEQIRLGSNELRIYISNELDAQNDRLGFKIERFDIQDVTFPRELLEATAQTEIAKRRNIEEINVSRSSAEKEINMAKTDEEVRQVQFASRIKEDDNKLKADLARVNAEARLKMERLNIEKQEAEANELREQSIAILKAEKEAKIKQIELESLTLQAQELQKKREIEIETELREIQSRHEQEMKIQKERLAQEEMALSVRRESECKRTRDLFQAGMHEDYFIAEQLRDSMTALATSGNVLVAPVGSSVMDLAGAGMFREMIRSMTTGLSSQKTINKE